MLTPLSRHLHIFPLSRLSYNQPSYYTTSQRTSNHPSDVYCYPFHYSRGVKGIKQNDKIQYVLKQSCYRRPNTVNKVGVRHQVGDAQANSGCQTAASEGSKLYKRKDNKNFKHFIWNLLRNCKILFTEIVKQPPRRDPNFTNEKTTRILNILYEIY